MKIKRFLSFLLCSLMAVTCLSACGDSDDPEGYTYNTYIGSSSVQTLSPMEWEYDAEEAIQTLTQRGLYDIIYSKDSDYELINEMAAAAPVDVTKDYAGDKTYGVPSSATKGYAYKIKLRKDATWDDGTEINADTYIYSMQQMLDPEAKNYRASTYTEGTYAIANAYEYASGGVAYNDIYDVDTGEYADVDEDDMYVSVSAASAYFGDSLQNAYDSDDYHDVFIKEDGTDTFEALSDAIGDNEYAKVEGDVKTALEDMIDTINTNFGDEGYDEEIYEFCFQKEKVASATWDEVGLIKNDDYTITIVYCTPIESKYMLYYGLTSNWLVKEDLYEDNKKEEGGLTKSTYGTSVDSYASYGPYKLTSWQEDKEIVIEKNDNWYGYSDDAFEGQYQTTKVVYQVIDEHSTALQLFLQGKLDDIALDATDLETYATSDYIVSTPTSYTYKISFNTDKDALASREEDGVNKTIITYKDFRKAFSLMIDRDEYCQACEPSSSAALGLLNDQYVYDVSDFSKYRDTAQAKAAIEDTYDGGDGYNVKEASQLFEQAYQEALAAGDIKKGDKVVLEFNCTTLSDTMQKTINFLNDALEAATKGTSLEGKVSIEGKEVDDYYSSMAAGTADIIFSAWGGSDNDPYSMAQCYVDETLYNDGEHGFDSTQEFTATINGQSYTMSFYDWYCELCLAGGKWATADADTRLQVLAAIEKNVLLEYDTVPLYNSTDSSLLSQKVEYVTYDFSAAYMESYGGFRFMTYNYNNGEWEDYCNENDNELSY